MTRYCFDRFCLDSEQKLLSRGDEPVRLTPRAFRLLEYLLMRRPSAISKQDLLDHIWSGSIVEESNLKSLVLEIRTALEQRGGRGDAIRTIYGFGYAFAGEVSIESPAAAAAPLVVLRWAEGVAQLPAGTYTIGRAAGCDVILDSPSVSREHAQLTITRDAIRLTDLDSKNGTFVGTARIHEPVDLFDLCRITFGEVAAEIARLGKDTSTETVDPA
jgi:DNA-binding winged helix-turn-helix (wHTH) protein